MHCVLPLRYALMMKYAKASLVLSLLLLIAPAHAELYKHTDSQGFITYSDTKTEGATQITPPQGNIIKLPKYVAKKRLSNDTKSASYATFIIVSPQNDTTIRDNNRSVTLSLSLTPELDTGKGHTIAAYIDGKLVISDNTTLTISINNIDRGSHTIYAVVRDSEANNLIKTKPVTIHLKQFSSLH